MQWTQPLLLGHFLPSSSPSGLVGRGWADLMLFWEEVILTPHHGSWTFLFSCPPDLTYFQCAAQILFAETPTRVNVSVGPWVPPASTILHSVMLCFATSQGTSPFPLL